MRKRALFSIARAWFGIAVVMACTCGPLFSYSDQITTERILGENKSFIDFIDVSVTNFGEESIAQFKDIYQMHFNAEVAYLQSDYKGAFKRVYSCQGKEAEMIAEIVKKYYLENSKDILDRLAPEIIKSKNQRARLYLTLAYRDRAIGFNHFVVGGASNPKLHSYKIFKYIESIKMTRRAKRYGFLALYESQTNEMKTRIFNHLFEMEREQGNPFYGRFLSKSGDSFLVELNRSFDDAEESAAADAAKDADSKSGQPGEPAYIEDQAEKKVAKRVRFRNEKTAANYILNAEFEKAEDIIRGYIDDFNFKIIKASLEVLSTNPGGGTDAIDYKALLPDHSDNYARRIKPSALDSFAGQVRVEDYVEVKTPPEDGGEKESPLPNKGVDDTLVTPDDKPGVGK